MMGTPALRPKGFPVNRFLAIALTIAAIPAAGACPPLLDHRVTSIKGEPVDLCQYAGKVVLVVNTASYCGFTGQYQGLESLYQRFGERGLVVLGVPSNDFGAQEPGSNEQVADFCERTYKVRFPMLEKAVVKGAEAAPLYRGLAGQTGQAPRWNFHKYLLGRDGRAIASYPSAVAPEDPKLVAAVEKALAER
jgi:glutathione peroxidase